MRKSYTWKPFAFFSRSIVYILLMVGTSADLYAQNTGAKITGIVKDSKGLPLPGVSVKLKGTQTGTVTDINGKYAITFPGAKSVIVFSYLGAQSKEMTVGTSTTIDVTLDDNATDLNEVVVTGYGQTVKKRDLTGSIGSVSAKQIQERQPINLFDALEGQIAGAQITTDGGDPLSQGNIQIRGASTLNAGNGPLYVIDGVISQDASYLNPADIASIEILKDAASASIYGARGGNGAILITTKGGHEGKANITANYYHLFSKLAHKLQTTSSDDLRYYRRYDINNSIQIDSLNHYLNADNDYQDLLFRTGQKDNINLSVSGGQKGITYYTGLTFISDRSIVLNSYARTLQGTTNINIQATSKFNITNNFNYSYVTGNAVDVANTARQVFERNPWTSIYRPDGQYAGYVESKRNPVAYAMLATNKPTLYKAQNNTSLNYDIMLGLRFTTTFNFRLDNSNTQTFVPLAIVNNGINTGSTEDDKAFFYNLQTHLNYDKSLDKNGDHKISAVIGFSRDKTSETDGLFSLRNYLTENAFASNVATIDLTKTLYNYPAYYATESLFGRAQYSYKSRYIINGTYRRDGSSRFGPDNKWGNFGAVGAAWRFSDESFMGWTKKWLEDGKLRFSYGTAGNDKLSDFGYLNLLAFGVANGNSGVYNGVQGVGLPTSIANPAIKWESTATTNLGLDLSMLGGRLTFSPEYYIKNTNGLLAAQNIAEETGYRTGTVNLGKIQNKGLELTVAGTPIQNTNFSWTVNANATIQSPGKIKELLNHTSYITGTSYQVKEGGNIGDFYIFKNLGVYQYDVSNTYDNKGDMLTPVGVSADGRSATGFTLNGQPYNGPLQHMTRNGNVLKGGSTIWQDTNGDNVIDDRDRQVLGNATPKFFFGFNNFFRYKNFTLNVLLNGQFGNKVYNYIANYSNSFSSTYTPPTPAAIYGAWRKPGDVTIYPNFNEKDVNGSMSPMLNSLYLESGSFIRLSSAKLTYSLDPKVASRIKTRQVSIYVYGNNLLTWTNYSWYDPEFTSGSALTAGMDSGKYPRRREAGLGLMVTL
jgi:TonB-linked SusC/RagA family outer membrane protein